MFTIILLYFISCHSTPVSTALSCRCCAGCKAAEHTPGTANWLRCPVQTAAVAWDCERGQNEALLGDAQEQDERHVLQHGAFQLDTRKLFALWREPSTNTGCPERLWGLHPWRYLNIVGANSSSWPALRRAGGGLPNTQRSLLSYSVVLSVYGQLLYCSWRSTSWQVLRIFHITVTIQGNSKKKITIIYLNKRIEM